MKRIRVGGLLLAAALAVCLPDPVRAQSGYNPSGAVFVPTMLLPQTDVTATGTTAVILQNINTVDITLTGNHSGLVASVEVSAERSPATQTWVAVPAHTVGIGRAGALRSLTTSGTYRINTAGFAAMRINVTTLSSGTASFSMSGSTATENVTVRPITLARYAASVVALSPAASATDFITLTGAANKVITITDVRCSAISTAAATATINAIKRSAVNTGGTSAAMTAISLDSSNVAAVATALSYTANPTLGTTVGNIGTTHITSVTAATTALPATVAGFSWPYPNGPRLRAATEVFALHGNAASFTTGFAANCTISWVEE